jgi:heptosyltransferase-2
MVMAQALYKALHANSTSAEIHVVAPEWSRSLLTRMPEISKTISLDVAHGELGLGKRYRLGKQLRQEHYQQAIVLPRSFKSALVPWVARIAKRAGDIGEFRHFLLTDKYPSNKSKLIPNVCNYLRYLNIEASIEDVIHNYLPTLNVDKINQGQLLGRHKISMAVPLVACMVGAEYGPSKQWPYEHFARLIDMLGEQNIQVCILGSEKDAQAGHRIAELCHHSVYNLCGKTSLTDVIDILAACDAAVSNDSGLMHIAAAVNTPVLVMYGGTTPAYTPPLHNKAKSFYIKVACSPCWQRKCRFDHYRCLTDILPEDVFREVEKKIAG